MPTLYFARFGTRLGLWLIAATAACIVDVLTKAAPHAIVVRHYAETSSLVLALVAAFLVALGVWHSRMVAVGAGLMFGGLCGNGGQVLLYGYASDWIPVGGWLTNVADIAGLLGLVWCAIAYALAWSGRPAIHAMESVRRRMRAD